MDETLDELLAQAEEIIADPDAHMFQPLIVLKLVVAMARELRRV